MNGIDLAAARFYIVERACGNIAHEHFFKCHGFGAELQAVGIGLFFAAVLLFDGVGQPKSGLPLKECRFCLYETLRRRTRRRG